MSDAASAPLTPQQIRELRELLAKATPAPWTATVDNEQFLVETTGSDGEWHVASLFCRAAESDAELICALRNHAGALLTLCDSQALALTQQQQAASDFEAASVAFENQTEAQAKQIAALTAERDALKQERERLEKQKTDFGQWVDARLAELEAKLAQATADDRTDLEFDYASQLSGWHAVREKLKERALARFEARGQV